MTEGRNRELIASEQMRDRIADYLLQEILRRDDRGSNSKKIQRALLPLERIIRAMPPREAK